jgi:hypothetical protein
VGTGKEPHAIPPVFGTESTKKVTIVAQMTAQGINPGNVVAQSDVTLVM